VSLFFTAKVFSTRAWLRIYWLSTLFSAEITWSVKCIPRSDRKAFDFNRCTLRVPGDMNSMKDMIQRCLSLGFTLSVMFAGTRRAAFQGNVLPKEPVSLPVPPPPPTVMPERPAASSFSGTVVRHGTRFALRESDGDLYALDSTGLAWPFEGEEVLISGYLNPDSGLLHICAIEELEDLREAV
jgi:Protein of unknown function (DUF5818)